MPDIPEFVVGKILVTDYLGGQSSSRGAQGDRFVKCQGAADDDLQSAGLDNAKLGGVEQPGFADPETPTAEEVRRLTIFNDYRGLMDTSRAGGFGTIAGPDRNGRVLGREYLALARLPDTDALFTVMAQIPEAFDTTNPMIMTAPSSGSRGVYGAISMAEWAFANRCAIAYTDKGTAPGFFDLDSGTGYGLDGLALPPGSTEEAVFRLADTLDLAAYRRALPHRLGVKHAHSKDNVEAHWGRYVLTSIRFALFCLSDWLGPGAGERPKTKVIAAGVSNGGSSALRAAELDDMEAPLIDAVVVSEPQVQPKPGPFAISYGGKVLTAHSRSFLDIVTLMDVYAPCAAFAIDTSDPSTPVQQRRAQRCTALGKLGLLKAAEPGAQAREALAIIHQFGFLPEADGILPALDMLGMWHLLAAVYSNAHARADITDHLCGVSIPSASEQGIAELSKPMRAQLTGWCNGLVYFVQDQKAGTLQWNQVRDDQVVLPWSLGAALCFRSLVTGVTYEQQNAVGAQWIDSGRVLAGVREVQASGNLHGKPAIILHGRSDALIAPNHSSRPYFGLNKTVEQSNSRLSYIEVVGGNHFDSFIPMFGAVLPHFGPNAYVPMHYYLDTCLDMMRAHLLEGAPLPASQVVVGSVVHKPWDTAGKAEADMPPPEIEPGPDRAITFANGVMTIPVG